MSDARNFPAEIAAAAARGDMQAMTMLAIELASIVKADEELRARDAERKGKDRDRKRASKRTDSTEFQGNPQNSTEVHGNPSASLSPLVPPPSPPEPTPTPPYNPPSPPASGSQIRLSHRTPRTRTAKQLPPYDAAFEEAWAQYPTRPGNSKAEAWEQWLRRVREGVDPIDMLTGTANYRRYCDSREWADRGLILMARTFYGPKRRFGDDWSANGSAFVGTPNPGGWYSDEIERLSRPA